MPVALGEADRAAGWRWSSAWNSWLCPVAHLISDGQVAQMMIRGPVACPLCACEAADRRTAAQRRADNDLSRIAALAERDRIDAQRRRPILTMPMPQVYPDTDPWWLADDPPTPRARRPKAKPEPEPVLTSKGRRYDLDEE